MHLSPARLRGTATSAVVCLHVCQSVRVHVSKNEMSKLAKVSMRVALTVTRSSAGSSGGIGG